MISKHEIQEFAWCYVQKLVCDKKTNSNYSKSIQLFHIMIIFIIGVSGCGKTTIGNELAKCISYQYFEADEFHSNENRIKMANGIPLDDADRQPWLASIARMLNCEVSNNVYL
jgi:adenylylsulfate kinase-like enzyme